MKLGFSFPQTSIPPNRRSIDALVTAVETLGYRHITAIEHVLGADPRAYPGWADRGIPWSLYDVDSTFYEPLTLFAYIAAKTRLELASGVIVLPQRQTALAAKQAATVDILTNGRLRLGVGVGWNELEFRALRMSFQDRGKRIEEQIALLRSLWTSRSTTLQGTFEQVMGLGIAPLPIQQPIPIWLGGSSVAAYRRIGRLADGWFPQLPPGPKLRAAVDTIAAAAETAGRDSRSIAMEGEVALDQHGVSKLVERLGRWRDAGASHATVNTMHAGFRSVDEHINALDEVARQTI